MDEDRQKYQADKIYIVSRKITMFCIAHAYGTHFTDIPLIHPGGACDRACHERIILQYAVKSTTHFCLQEGQLNKATEMSNSHSNTCQELEIKLAEAETHAENLQAQHSDQTEAQNKHALNLNQELQAAKAKATQLDLELEAAGANNASADAQIVALKQCIAEHEVHLQAVQDQLQDTKQSLLAQLSTHETMSKEHEELRANHDEQSSALQAVQTELISKLADIGQLTAKLLSETTAKVCLPRICSFVLLAVQHQPYTATACCYG